MEEGIHNHSIGYQLTVSVNQLLVSVNQLLVSVNQLLVSVNQLVSGDSHLDTSTSSPGLLVVEFVSFQIQRWLARMCA